MKNILALLTLTLLVSCGKPAGFVEGEPQTNLGYQDYVQAPTTEIANIVEEFNTEFAEFATEQQQLFVNELGALPPLAVYFDSGIPSGILPDHITLDKLTATAGECRFLEGEPLFIRLNDDFKTNTEELEVTMYHELAHCMLDLNNDHHVHSDDVGTLTNGTLSCPATIMGDAAVSAECWSTFKAEYIADLKHELSE